MRARAALALVLAGFLAGGCLGLGDPPPRALPEDLAEPSFILASDEAQGPLLIGGAAGLRVSRDGGRTWETPEGGDEPVVTATASQSRILVSRGETVQPYRNDLTGPEDAPQAWPFDAAVAIIAGSPRRARLWAITQTPEQTLHYSNDGGATWWLPPALGLCAEVRALAVGPPVQGRNERLWVACGDDGLYASDDLGVAFARVVGVDRADDVSASRETIQQVVVATPTVATSRDGGASWAFSGLLARLVAVDPRSADLVFAVDVGGQLFASLDGGATFNISAG